ncbi:helix-turn-helix domain-containing protein [Rhizorhabdus sp.]|uniref:MarR family winged helix-turn-helix transcriptional regulator n=1 Tax=Rhizorhabdus sp. TaxID=1968843 RepID=UPI0011F58C4A|nr:helix-turn-helix domain-containing protein [Rhizorhabdus sp.]MBD3761212.1 MarR family transcriptional regulator [Rhizorhabdus sp.]TAK13946.1 MAG: MarR family transcriptional regulator [Rhizorhabdus sp.]
MSNTGHAKPAVSQRDYETLAAFRFELRKFLAFSEQAAKALGMTPQQHQSLLAIRAAPDRMLTIGDLAEQLFIQPHTASELADRMVALGWLERRASAGDRRRVCLALTEAAGQMLASMSATHRGEVLRIRGTLTELLARLED